jgi:hypothetical protein
MILRLPRIWMYPASKLAIEMSIPLTQMTYDQKWQTNVCHPKIKPSFKQHQGLKS